MNGQSLHDQAHTLHELHKSTYISVHFPNSAWQIPGLEMLSYMFYDFSISSVVEETSNKEENSWLWSLCKRLKSVLG